MHDPMNDQERRALSLRAIQREYGFSRSFVSNLIAKGEIRGCRHGRAILVLREDFEDWFRNQASRSRNRTEDRVAEVLDRSSSR